MASGNQKVKTPTGWNATQGAWVKTGPSTWKAVDQIYIKTPTGWNDASGQELTQIPYPYIANAQEPNIRDAQQPYPYIANAQEPNIRDAQQPYPYIANAQEPNIRDAQQPYPYIANAQEPNIRASQTPFTYPANAQEPNIRASQTPFTYQSREPNNYNYRSPYTYNYRSPYSYNYRSPFTYQAPARQPLNYNYRSPFTYQAPARQPFTYNYRVPFTYQAPARQPVNSTYQSPYITPYNYQSPYIAPARQPVYVPPLPGGCFDGDTMVKLPDGSSKKIMDVKVNDVLLSYNFAENRQEDGEVKGLYVGESHGIYEIWFENGSVLRVTGGHPLYIQDKGWGVISFDEMENEPRKEGYEDLDPRALTRYDAETDSHIVEGKVEFELQVGDILEGKVIKEILHREGITKVYHALGVGGNANFYADDVLAHNIPMQQKGEEP